MRISKKDPFKWFLNNFGIGGIDNCSDACAFELMEGILKILESGYIELDWIGRFLLQLSNNPKTLERFYNDLKEYLSEERFYNDLKEYLSE
jgi:hypothetical protein